MNCEYLPTGRGYEIPSTWQVKGDEPLVCIVAHGFGSSMESPTARMLLEQLPLRDMGVAAFDFPAHGVSRADGEYLRLGNCMADLADMEDQVRRRAPGAEIVYFGSSFGAYTILNYLAGGTRRGRRAFLRSAAVCMPALFHSRPRHEEEAMEANGHVILGADYGYTRPLKVVKGFVEDLDAHDLFTCWRREAGEVRMIHGAADRVIPLVEADGLPGPSISP